MMMSLNKKLKETPIDRLSELPDSLITHILSFLEVQQSAITAVLSKRWQFLWRESPKLLFVERNIQANKVREFVNRVHRTLVICGRNGLESFLVEFRYSKIFSFDVDVWVNFAVKNKVEQICLLLNSSSSAGFYKLPEMMFRNSYSKHLSLRGCIVDPMKTVDWRSLTDLCIERAELQQHVIEKILSGCPVLCNLSLLYCWGFNHLEVVSKNLDKLLVWDLDGVNNEPLLRISAPYLHVLCVSLYPRGRKLCVGNISSLVRAAISFTGNGWDVCSVEVMDNALEILNIIRHAKVVEIEYGYSEVLSSMAMSGYQFPRSARTHLSVIAPAEMCNIHGIIGLLESSPNLESLVIEGFCFVGEPYICPVIKSELDCDLLHLKTITIKSFVHKDLAGEPMLTLARILLNKAPALEKMVVNIEEIGVTSLTIEHFMIWLTLLSYPRSSVKSVVILNYPRSS